MNREDFIRARAAEIRHQRFALNMSQQELADAVGVSPMSISNWERGVGTISAFSYAKLVAFFARALSTSEEGAKREVAL